MKLYAGIGARITPPEVLLTMKELAVDLSVKQYTLRSGGAEGADKAFESASVNKEIFIANDATEQAIAYAGLFHPKWNYCNNYVKKLHARNAMILLGRNLDTPVEFVVCWTPYGKTVGGTGQGIRMAIANNIPVYNIAIEGLLEKLYKNHCNS